jgi:hypothetical protein
MLAVAHSWTVTVLRLVTAALRMIEPLGRVPSDALTYTGRPTVAPATVAVPEAQLPAVSALPPMLAVVPLRVGVVTQLGHGIVGAVAGSAGKDARDVRLRTPQLSEASEILR